MEEKKEKEEKPNVFGPIFSGLKKTMEDIEKEEDAAKKEKANEVV